MIFIFNDISKTVFNFVTKKGQEAHRHTNIRRQKQDRKGRYCLTA